MKKLIFSFVLVFVLSATAYAEPVWEVFTNEYEDSYRYKNCVVFQDLESNMLVISIWDGEYPTEDMTVITKDGGVMRIIPASFGMKYRTDVPGEKKKEDSFPEQCREAVKFLPKNIKNRIESYWDLYE